MASRGSQKRPLIELSPSPPPPGPSAALSLSDDSDAGSLTELDSDELEVPTQYQRTNHDSTDVLAEPITPFEVAFDYTWVDWGHRQLAGCTQASSPARYRAWWWRFGVPIERWVYNAGMQKALEKLFVCRTCHKSFPDRNCLIEITNGGKGVTDHFKSFHWGTYSVNNPSACKQIDRGLALEIFDSKDPKQQKVYNQLIEKLNPRELQKDILRWLVCENIAFRQVNSPYFRQIFDRIQPFVQGDILPSRRSVTRWILREFKLHQNELIKKLQRTYGQVHISFDVWTSRKRKAMNGVTGHWVDHRGRCQSALLGLTEMDDVHSGENLCKNTIGIINTYGLRDRIGYFVLDNASSNDTAVDHLAKELNFNPAWRRLRCAGHIINLIARQVLFGEDYAMFDMQLLAGNLEEQVQLWRKKGPVGYIFNIIRWINRSLGRLQRFNNSQRELFKERNPDSDQEPEILALLQDNSTR